MDRQFRGQVTDGLLLPILQLLVRTDHTVLGYRYVRLDEAGQIVERAPGYHAPGKIGNKGVEIDFRTDGDQSVHKLFYFSVNLSNQSLRDNSPFQSFVSGSRDRHIPQGDLVYDPQAGVLHRSRAGAVEERRRPAG